MEREFIGSIYGVVWKIDLKRLYFLRQIKYYIGDKDEREITRIKNQNR